MKKAQWITPARDMGDLCPVFRRVFAAEKPVEKAGLQITALGVYEAELNGKRVGKFVLAPGWTSYEHRLQVQTYDVTELLFPNNELRVSVGRGWFRSPVPGWDNDGMKKQRFNQPCGLIALLRIRYTDGTEETVVTDEAWETSEGPVRFSEIYDGETCDARVKPDDWKKAKILDWPKDILIPQEGEEIREMERVAAREIIRTAAGETVVDFGQEVTGWVEFTIDARAGELVHFNHGEVLDKDGNFYNENYRGAKAEVRYICGEGKQTWHPRFTFFGFLYIHLISWPGEPKAEDFTAVAVYSNMARTG
ncbi:MAG: family 78 glycoside hydrolase catalytic domain, partial [Clostridia bacterium]|nr:family 78 glycoside hydrolase catalytic domain [Clostridia bacterium]